MELPRQDPDQLLRAIRNDAFWHVFPRRHPTQKSFGLLQGWQEPFGEHLPLFMWKRQIQRR